MKLLQQLESVVVTSKNGITRKRKQGLFYCPMCQESVVRWWENGFRCDTCGKKGCRTTTAPTHNQSKTRLYTIWNNLVERCSNPRNKSYKYYGAKGISFPEHWGAFEGFFRDMGMAYSDGLTIDRIDNTKDYSKENCQWITLEENTAKDKRKAVAKYTLDGEFITSYPSVQLAVAAEGYKFNSCIARVARGERKQYKGFAWKYI